MTIRAKRISDNRYDSSKRRQVSHSVIKKQSCVINRYKSPSEFIWITGLIKRSIFRSIKQIFVFISQLMVSYQIAIDHQCAANQNTSLLIAQ